MLKKIINKTLAITGYQFTKIQSLENQIKSGKYKWLEEFGVRTVIDIGANKGQFAKWIIKILPEVYIYSFEPLLNCFNELEKNLSEIKNSKCFNYALGDSENDMEMFENEFSPSSSLLKMNDAHIKMFPYTKNSNKTKIKLKTLDSFEGDLKLSAKVLVKIDVQGFELNVLKGAERTLSKIDILIIETSFMKLYEEQPLFFEIIQYLYNKNFNYAGNISQELSSTNGRVVQEDSIFIRSNK